MIDVEALKAKVDLVALVGSYTALEKAGTEWKGLCPFHDDHNPSFYVSPKKGFVHCFACGANHDAISFVQEIQGTDFNGAVAYLDSNPPLMPQLSKPERPPLPDRVTSKPPEGNEPKSFKHFKFGEPEAVRALRDLDGSLLGFEARYPRGSDPDEPKKSPSRMWTWGSRGSEEWGWNMGVFTRPRPLYGLDRIAGKPQILVHEGPKKADAGQQLLPGAASISWTGGAQNWKHHDWTPIKAANCIIWPDNDDPGLKAAENLAQVLSDPKGLNCSVAFVADPDKPQGWDAANALAEGWTVEQSYAWAKAHKVPYTHKSVELSDQTQGASEAVGAHIPDTGGSTPPPATESSAAQISSAGPPPPSPAAATALDPTDADTAPPGDEQPVPYADTPPPEGSTPERAPSKPRRPRLASVDGNPVRKPAIEDDPDLPAALTENGSAARFAALHKDDFRVVHEWGGKHGATWLAWDGGRWKREPTRLTAMQQAKVFAAGLEYQSEAAALTRASKDKFNSHKYIVSFLQLSQFDPQFIAAGALFDANSMMLGTPGGTVDLRAGKLIEPERAHYLTRQTAVTPAPGPHPLFDSVVERIAAGDATLRAYVWKALGYSLTGDQREENFWFLYGKPQSGKTTLIEAVAAILGNAVDGGYAATCDMDLFTESRNDRGNERMAELAGARFVYASETEEGRNWKAALLKLAVGGDTLRGRMLYENAFSFRPTHHIWIFGNSRPHLKSKDDGIKRRLHLLEYPGVISDEERDNTLKMRMVAEYPAILHSMILGCLDWQNEGLGKPDSVIHAVDQYLQAEDTLQTWLDECCDLDPNEKTQTSAAYHSFKNWASSGGEYVLSQKRFSAALEEREFARMKYGGQRYIRGFKLRLIGDDRNPPPYYQRD